MKILSWNLISQSNYDQKKIKKNKTFQQKKQFWNNDIYKLRNIL